jgi:hypothetical protein
MDRFNAYMNGLCAEGESDCTVLQEVLSEKWTSDDFVDDGHLNKHGGEKLAKLVGRVIENKPSKEL